MSKLKLILSLALLLILLSANEPVKQDTTKNKKVDLIIKLKQQKSISMKLDTIINKKDSLKIY